MKKLRKSDLEKVFSFMPKAEADAVRTALKGEEKSFFTESMQKIHEIVSRHLPKLYAQESKGGAAIAWLHYFHPSGSNWLVTEFDGNRTFFGFACLSGRLHDAEYGYVDLEELRSVGAELDLYFEPKPICIAGGDRIFNMTAAEVAFEAVSDDDTRSLQACLEYGVSPNAVREGMTLEEYAFFKKAHQCRKVLAAAVKNRDDDRISQRIPC